MDVEYDKFYLPILPKSKVSVAKVGMRAHCVTSPLQALRHSQSLDLFGLRETCELASLLSNTQHIPFIIQICVSAKE